MSSLMTHARTRVPQLAEAAQVRARLAIVPARATSARRTPFAVLLFGLLVAGVVGLLMFNTHMQQRAFAASELEAKATALEAEQQSLHMDLQRLRDPQRVAQAARDLGMVMPANPAFLQMRTGKVIGKPVPANADGALFVRNFKATKPAVMKPKPKIVRVPAAITPATGGTNSANSGAAGRASADSTSAAGKKKEQQAGDPSAAVTRD